MEMKNTYCFLLMLACTLFCCKKTTVNNKETVYTIFNDSISKKENRIKTLKLKTAIQKKMDESQSFSVTKDYIDSLNLAPFNQIDEIAYILNEQLEELPRELDTILKTKGVLSRIRQMETYCRAINFEISKQYRDTVKINEHLTKVLTSYNSLITQLNETSAKLPEDFKKQLEKAVEIKKDTLEGVPLF